MKDIIVLCFLVIMNLISFLFMFIDKRKAIKQHTKDINTRRIPERVLFLFASLFGGIGGTLGIILCRHKTKHWYFTLFFPLMMILQVLLLIYFYTR